MKSVNGGKVKNDKADSENITHLLRGGNLPKAYVYPKELRSTRDLLRRRMHLMRKRSELLAHVQNSHSQHNLKNEGLSTAYKGQRDKLVGNFKEKSIRLSINMDIATIKHYDELLAETERYLIEQARTQNPQLFSLLKTIPGIGDILALVIMYEVHDVKRFATVSKFLSYSRMVKPKRSSAGKAKPSTGSKQGNAYLKWAFSEASVLFLRNHQPAKAYFQKLTDKYGKGKALSLLGQKLARASFQVMRTKQVFDAKRFLQELQT
jgi:transposase